MSEPGARCVPVKDASLRISSEPAVYGMDLLSKLLLKLRRRDPLCHSKAEKHKFFHGILPGKNFLILTDLFQCSARFQIQRSICRGSSTGGFRITMPRKARTPDNPSFSSSRYCGGMRSPALHNWKSHTGKNRILRGFPPFWHTFRVLYPHPADPVSAPQTGFPAPRSGCRRKCAPEKAPRSSEDSLPISLHSAPADLTSDPR